MSAPCYGRVHNQRGKYNSPAHESMRAAVRCMIVHVGENEARRHAEVVAGWRNGSDLTPSEAYFCRKVLETQLPECEA